MTRLLKTFERLVLGPAGYRVLREGQTNLLPAVPQNDSAASNCLTACKALFDGRDGAPVPTALTVYLRTGLRASQRQQRNAATGDTLETAVAACLASLVASIKRAAEVGALYDLRVAVYDDNSDAVGRALIERLLGHLTVPWDIAAPTGRESEPILQAQLRQAAEADRLAYFVAQDVLHLPDAVSGMIGFYRQIHCTTGGPLLLYPQARGAASCDGAGPRGPSYLLLGPDRHWCSTPEHSPVFFTQGRVLADSPALWEQLAGLDDAAAEGSRAQARLHTAEATLRPVGFYPLSALAVGLESRDFRDSPLNWKALYATYRTSA